MESAIDYAKAQKRNGHLALAITVAIIIASALLIYFSRTGVVKNLGFLFILGLMTIIILFGLSAALFYNRSKSTELILKDPLVHWKYDSDTDFWLEEGTAEAIISDHGIYYSPAHDKLHNFWSPSSKLEYLKAGTLPGHDYMTMNFFFIRAITYEGNTISATLHVPVPKGSEDLAEKLIEQLNQNLKLNKAKRIKLLSKMVIGFFVFMAMLVVIFRLFGR